MGGVGRNRGNANQQILLFYSHAVRNGRLRSVPLKYLARLIVSQLGVISSDESVSKDTQWTLAESEHLVHRRGSKHRDPENIVFDRVHRRERRGESGGTGGGGEDSIVQVGGTPQLRC